MFYFSTYCNKSLEHHLRRPLFIHIKKNMFSRYLTKSKSILQPDLNTKSILKQHHPILTQLCDISNDEKRWRAGTIFISRGLYANGGLHTPPPPPLHYTAG